MAQYNFTILLVGEPDVGKSSFMRRWICGRFAGNRHGDAEGQGDISTLLFDTTIGTVALTVVEISDDARVSGRHVDGAIVMFDLTNRPTYQTAGGLVEWVRGTYSNQIPLVLVGNKCDIRNRAVLPRNIKIHRQLGVFYYDVSAKSMHNYEKPFLFLMRKLTGIAGLEFAEGVEIPHQVTVNVPIQDDV